VSSARRTVVVVVAALPLALGAFVAPGATSAAQEDDGPASQARMQLASQTPWVQPDGEFSMRLVLDDALLRSGRELAVSVYQRLTSRSAFALTLEDVFVGSPLRVAAAPVTELSRDAGAAVRVSVPVRSEAVAVDPDGPDRLLLRREGVYPVRVEVRIEGGGRVLSRLTTHLVRLPAGGDVRPLSVAWVQPVTASPAHAPDGTVALADGGRRGLDRVLDGLTAAAGVPLTLAPVPETIEALAASAAAGESGGAGGDQGAREESARDAERLRAIREAAGRRQVLAGPFAPVSTATLARSGLGDELVAHVTRGEDALASSLAVRPDRRTWLADEPLDERSIVELRRVGVQRLVVPGEALEPVDLPLTVTRPFEVQGALGRTVDAVAADSGLAAHFPTGPAADPVLLAHHLLADLAVLYFDLPGVQRGVAVAPPAHWEPSARFLISALHGIDSSPIVEPVTVDGLFDTVPPGERDGEVLLRELADIEAPRLGLPPTAVRATRERLSGYAALTTPTNPLLASAEVPLLLATSSAVPRTERRRYLDGANAIVDEEVELIRAPDGEGITLTAREGSIPLTIQNLTGRPASVHLELDSDKLEFPAGSTRDVRLDQRNTTIEVTVRTRTSGAFPLGITVTSPDGRLLVSRTRITVRSTAVSGVGLVVTVGAGVFLAGWWGRHLRDGRRARRLVRRR